MVFYISIIEIILIYIYDISNDLGVDGITVEAEGEGAAPLPHHHYYYI